MEETGSRRVLSPAPLSPGSRCILSWWVDGLCLFAVLWVRVPRASWSGTEVAAGPTLRWLLTLAGSHLLEFPCPPHCRPLSAVFGGIVVYSPMPVPSRWSVWFSCHPVVSTWPPSSLQGSRRGHSTGSLGCLLAHLLPGTGKGTVLPFRFHNGVGAFVPSTRLGCGILTVMD